MKDIGGLLIGIVVVLTIVLLLPLIILIVVPLVIIQDVLSKRRLKKWLSENEQSYFIIYTLGRRKRQFIEKEVLPLLPEDIITVRFDGVNHNGDFDSSIAHALKIYQNHGFPVIGKIIDGKVRFKSLKSEYKELVQQEKDIGKFVDVLLDEVNLLDTNLGD